MVLAALMGGQALTTSELAAIAGVNEVRTGTTLIRDFKREEDKLIYATRPASFPGDGKVSVFTVVWEVK